MLGDFIGHLDVKKNRTSSPRGESPGLPVESSTLSSNGSQKIRLSPVTCVTSPPATNDSMDSSNILSPLNLFSSQQMVIRWGPVSPALLLKRMYVHPHTPPHSPPTRTCTYVCVYAHAYHTHTHTHTHTHMHTHAHARIHADTDTRVRIHTQPIRDSI